MGSGQGPGEVSLEEAVKKLLNADYAQLEARSLAKMVSFGRAYGSGPRALNALIQGGLGAYDPDIWKSYACKYCDKTKGAHTRTQCLYRRTELRYQRLGYVPFLQHGGGKFRKRGVHVHLGSCGITHVNRWKKENTTFTLRAYIPIWAAILYDEAGLNGVSGRHKNKKKVREFWRKISFVLDHPGEELAILGEHILAGGKYSEACNAYLERKK